MAERAGLRVSALIEEIATEIGDRDGELLVQTPGDAGHGRHRNEDRDQRPARSRRSGRRPPSSPRSWRPWGQARPPSSQVTASTTTMASSTTMPIASTRPSSESVLIEKPSSGKTAKAPISETGTVSVGISVAAEALQEDVDDQDHQADGLEQRDDDLADAGRDRAASCRAKPRTRGRRGSAARGRPSPGRTPAFCHSRPFASGQLEDLQEPPVELSVRARVDQVVLRAELDLRHVAQQDLRAVRFERTTTLPNSSAVSKRPAVCTV